MELQFSSCTSILGDIEWIRMSNKSICIHTNAAHTAPVCVVDDVFREAVEVVGELFIKLYWRGCFQRWR